MMSWKSRRTVEPRRRKRAATPMRERESQMTPFIASFAWTAKRAGRIVVPTQSQKGASSRGVMGPRLLRARGHVFHDEPEFPLVLLAAGELADGRRHDVGVGVRALRALVVVGRNELEDRCQQRGEQFVDPSNDLDLALGGGLLHRFLVVAHELVLRPIELVAREARRPAGR